MFGALTDKLYFCHYLNPCHHDSIPYCETIRFRLHLFASKKWIINQRKRAPSKENCKWRRSLNFVKCSNPLKWRQPSNWCSRQNEKLMFSPATLIPAYRDLLWPSLFKNCNDGEERYKERKLKEKKNGRRTLPNSRIRGFDFSFNRINLNAPKNWKIPTDKTPHGKGCDTTSSGQSFASEPKRFRFFQSSFSSAFIPVFGFTMNPLNIRFNFISKV